MILPPVYPKIKLVHRLTWTYVVHDNAAVLHWIFIGNLRSTCAVWVSIQNNVFILTLIYSTYYWFFLFILCFSFQFSIINSLKLSIFASMALCTRQDRYIISLFNNIWWHILSTNLHSSFLKMVRPELEFAKYTYLPSAYRAIVENTWEIGLSFNWQEYSCSEILIASDSLIFCIWRIHYDFVLLVFRYFLYKPSVFHIYTAL